MFVIAGDSLHWEQEAHYVTLTPGLYEHDACEVCGNKPSAHVVRWWDHPPGGSRPVSRVESHYFCGQHSAAAYAMHRQLRQHGPAR